MAKNYLKEVTESGGGPENRNHFYELVLPWLGEEFFPDKSAKILDVGAGGGHSLLPFKEAGWRNLWALDIDDFNGGFFKKNNINFGSLDIEKDKLPYESVFFDAVISFHVIEHLNKTDIYLNEISRVLKPGGVLILVTPDWRKQYKTFWRDHTHVHPYDKESMGRILRAYDFDVVFVKNFGLFRGVGKLGIWKLIKPLMFTGIDMVAVARKK